jgi:hypothetical protein
MRESKTDALDTSGHHSDPESHARSQNRPLRLEKDAESENHDELLASYSDIAGRMQSEIATGSMKQKGFADLRRSSRKREFEIGNGKKIALNDGAMEGTGTHVTYLMHRELRDMESRLSNKVEHVYMYMGAMHA